MTDVLAQDSRGNALLSFRSGAESDLDELDLPCPLALVIAWHEGRCLLVFDRWKQAWELRDGRGSLDAGLVRHGNWHIHRARRGGSDVDGVGGARRLCG